MKIISHRGNLDGPQEQDNVISELERVSKDMLVEVDVWHMEHGWYLGHDGPEEPSHLILLRTQISFYTPRI